MYNKQTKTNNSIGAGRIIYALACLSIYSATTKRCVCASALVDRCTINRHLFRGLNSNRPFRDATDLWNFQNNK